MREEISRNAQNGGIATSVAGRGDRGAPKPARRFLGDDDEPDTGNSFGSGAGAWAVLGKIPARWIGSSAFGHAAGGNRLRPAVAPRPPRSAGRVPGRTL